MCDGVCVVHRVLGAPRERWWWGGRGGGGGGGVKGESQREVYWDCREDKDSIQLPVRPNPSNSLN
jgi:hypothetical protein